MDWCLSVQDDLETLEINLTEKDLRILIQKIGEYSDKEGNLFILNKVERITLKGSSYPQSEA